MSLKQIPISKIYSLPTEPLNKVEGRFWFNTDTTSVSGGKLYRCDGTNWVPVNVGSDYVTVKLPDNSTPISLTTYLNNQISALSEGISEVESEVNNQKIITAKTGRFFFNGGTFQATQKQALGTTFSICRTIKIKWEDWETLADYRYFDGNNLGWGSNETIGWGFAVISHRLYFYYRPLPKSSGGTITILDLSTAQTQAIMDGNTHTLIVIGANNTISLYVDGILIKSKTVTGGIIDIPTPSYVQTIRQITGEYSRIKQFNFDMSADDAHYTIEDYCTGIEEPPSLHNPSAEYHADYSYVNFAMTRNDSTRIVLDNSGYNNYATPSDDIIGDKDQEVLNFASTAITAEIDSLSTQLSNKFNDKVAELQISKANSGVLRCNGGYVVANNIDYPEVFSVAFRTDWDFVDTSKKFTPLKLGMSGTYGLSFYSVSSDGRLRLYVNTSSVSNVAVTSYKYVDIRSQLGTGLNSFVLVLAKDTDGNFLPKFYVNNNLIENLSTTKVPAFAMGSGEFKLNCYTANNITAGEVAYQDVCLFNFDISAENAPYTLADYQTGKSIPPSLKSGGQVSLALEDYTIGGKILDYSGNKNHATITGSVVGDNDSSIDVFTSQLSTGSGDSSDINTLYAQLSANNSGIIVDASNVYYDIGEGYSGNVEGWLSIYNGEIHHLQYQMTQIGDQGNGVKYRNVDDYLTINEGFSNVKAEIDSLSSQLSNSSSNSTLTNLPVYNLDGSLAGESKGIQITKTASGKYTLEIITSSGEVNGDGTIPLQPVYDETGNIVAGENKTLRIVKSDGAYTIEIL